MPWVSRADLQVTNKGLDDLRALMVGYRRENTELCAVREDLERLREENRKLQDDIEKGCDAARQQGMEAYVERTARMFRDELAKQGSGSANGRGDNARAAVAAKLAGLPRSATQLYEVMVKQAVAGPDGVVIRESRRNLGFLVTPELTEAEVEFVLKVLERAELVAMVKRGAAGRPHTYRIMDGKAYAARESEFDRLHAHLGKAQKQITEAVLDTQTLTREMVVAVRTGIHAKTEEVLFAGLSRAQEMMQEAKQATERLEERVKEALAHVVPSSATEWHLDEVCADEHAPGEHTASRNTLRLLRRILAGTNGGAKRWRELKDDVARETGMDKSTVRRVVGDLHRAGILWPYYTKGGSGKPAVYGVDVGRAVLVLSTGRWPATKADKDIVEKGLEELHHKAVEAVLSPIAPGAMVKPDNRTDHGPKGSIELYRSLTPRKRAILARMRSLALRPDARFRDGLHVEASIAEITEGLGIHRTVVGEHIQRLVKRGVLSIAAKSHYDKEAGKRRPTLYRLDYITQSYGPVPEK